MSNDYPKPIPSGKLLQFDRAIRPANGEPMLKREEMAALIYKLMDSETSVSTREELNDWWGTVFDASLVATGGMGIAAAAGAAAALPYGETAGMLGRGATAVVNAAPVLGLISMPLLLAGDTRKPQWYENNIGSAAFAIVDRISPSMWTAGTAAQMDLRPALADLVDKTWSKSLIKEQDKVAKTMATNIAKLLHGGSADAPGYTPQQIDAYVKNSVDAWKSKPGIVGLSPTVLAADAVKQYTAANNKPVSTTPTPSTNNEPITTTSLAPTTTTTKPAPTTTTMAPTTTTLSPTTTTSTTTSSTMPPTTTTIAPSTGTTTTTSSTMPTTTTPATTPPTAPPATTPSGGTNAMDFDPNEGQDTDVSTNPVLNRDSMLRAFRVSQSRDLTDFARQNFGTELAPQEFGNEFTMKLEAKSAPLSVYDALSFLYTRTNDEVQAWENRMLEAGVYEMLPNGMYPAMEGNAYDPANIAGWDWLLSQSVLAGMGADEMLTALKDKYVAEKQRTGLPGRFIEDDGAAQGRPAYNSADRLLHYDASGNIVTTSADLVSPVDIGLYGNKVSQSLSETDLTLEQSNGLQDLVWDMQSAYKPQLAPSEDGKLQAFDHQAAIYKILASERSGGGINKQLDDALKAITMTTSAGTP